MTPVEIYYLNDVEIVIDGLVLASKWHKEWPLLSRGSENSKTKHVNFWTFNDCTDLKISGSGKIDGQGFMWWVREFFSLNLAHRPKLIQIASTKGIEISGVKIHNSPSFHIVPTDCEDIYMHDFEIVASYMGMFEPFRFFNLPAIFENRLQFPMPIFPLNTDGIDVAARNATFRNVNVTNYDDAIVPKPSHAGKRINCTEDILVENSHVHLSVGMSIGSVPPNLQHSCVRNVMFRNIKFTTPLKAIYIKTNPGDAGSGEIRNVTYENIDITNPVWWGIYIGPQQQKQPGTGAGPGCMFYPLNKTCPTQPRITISDITLRNVTSSGGLLPAGIIRCNETNPCKNFNFENVDIRSEFWDTLGQGYIVENIEGTTSNVFPDPGFGQKQPESVLDTFM